MAYIVRVKGKWQNAQDWYHISFEPDNRHVTTNCKANATKYPTAAEAFVVAKQVRKPFNVVRVVEYK